MNKPETMTIDDVIKKTFNSLGYKILYVNEKPSANGVDLWVIKDGCRPKSVEIKKVRRQKTGAYQVDPVQKNRVNDDLIAIIVNDKYVLVDDMQNHIACCSTKGTRQFTKLLN